jgi:hypothetical protein
MRELRNELFAHGLAGREKPEVTDDGRLTNISSKVVGTEKPPASNQGGVQHGALPAAVPESGMSAGEGKPFFAKLFAKKS